jgi:hypothetical protein
MKKLVLVVCIAMVVCLGCAKLDFGKQGLEYWTGKPYLLVGMDNKCVSSSNVIMVPSEPRYVKLKSGMFGSSNLSLTLNNGMIQSVGQNSDTQIPQLLSSITGLVPAIAKVALKAPEPGTNTKVTQDNNKPVCVPSSKLYPIINGAVVDQPINIIFQQ